MKKLLGLAMLMTVLLGMVGCTASTPYQSEDQLNPNKEICDVCGTSLRGVSYTGN